MNFPKVKDGEKLFKSTCELPIFGKGKDRVLTKQEWMERICQAVWADMFGDRVCPMMVWEDLIKSGKLIELKEEEAKVTTGYVIKKNQRQLYVKNVDCFKNPNKPENWTNDMNEALMFKTDHEASRAMRNFGVCVAIIGPFALADNKNPYKVERGFEEYFFAATEQMFKPEETLKHFVPEEHMIEAAKIPESVPKKDIVEPPKKDEKAQLPQLRWLLII